MASAAARDAPPLSQQQEEYTPTEQVRRLQAAPLYHSHTDRAQQVCNEPAPCDAPTQEVDALIAEALACPCVDDLKASACGKSFVDAFTCFRESSRRPCCLARHTQA